MKQKLYFITYSDSQKYNISKTHILGLAKESGFFHSCEAFKKKDLDQNFIDKYSEILNQNKGGGYYLWKPIIIRQFINKIDEGDIVVYTDAGSSFNYNAKTRFYNYIELLNSSDFGNLRFESKKENLEKYWTTKEIFKYFKTTPESSFGKSTQLMGGHLIFKKNDHTKELLNEFFNVIDSDKNLITDHYNTNQISNFKENRHDQSILSLLSKKFGGVILKNETFFDKDSKDQINFPFLSVRHYGHGLIDRVRFKLGYKRKTPIYF